MKDVKMYTLSSCPWCKKTKEFFRSHEIPFEYV
ncbi:MAG: glutaredoxin family protein, partial [Methanobacterium sp.]